MAWRKAKGEEQVSCNLVFDGTLLSRVKGSLVIELIKYLLYERQQIPLPIDHVKQELQRLSEQSGNGTAKPKSRQLNKLEVKRATNTVKNLEELSAHVLQVFEMCPETRQVLLIFGGTSVSPKESYLVNLPGINPEAEGLPLKTCVKSLYKQLISQDIMGSSKPMKTTSLRVLLFAPREGRVEWFLPRPAFKVPTRGKQYVMNFCGKQSHSYGHNLTKDEPEIEISGIEPLERSDTSMSFEVIASNDDVSLSPMERTWLQDYRDSCSSTPCATRYMMDKTSDVMNHNEMDELMGDCVEEEELFGQEDQQYMWFQAPLVVKGYKDKSSRHASLIK